MRHQLLDELEALKVHQHDQFVLDLPHVGHLQDVKHLLGKLLCLAGLESFAAVVVRLGDPPLQPEPVNLPGLGNAAPGVRPALAAAVVVFGHRVVPVSDRAVANALAVWVQPVLVAVVAVVVQLVVDHLGLDHVVLVLILLVFKLDCDPQLLVHPVAPNVLLLLDAEVVDQLADGHELRVLVVVDGVPEHLPDVPLAIGVPHPVVLQHQQNLVRRPAQDVVRRVRQHALDLGQQRLVRGTRLLRLWTIHRRRGVHVETLVPAGEDVQVNVGRLFRLLGLVGIGRFRGGPDQVAHPQVGRVQALGRPVVAASPPATSSAALVGDDQV